MIPRKVRSFVRRDGRMTAAQEYAFTHHMASFGLPKALLNFHEVFARVAPTIIEIGFGAGASLFEVAKANPSNNFIGMETHKPGVGQLLQNIASAELTNLRIYYGDAVEALQEYVMNESVDTFQIFFPDPWPKRRHHKRRIIQPEFVELLGLKLKPGGTLHLATDWEEYAKHMMEVLSSSAGFS
ncbi:MAG TPA: tRNA (guanosine(46)-N7)-methyltransferase TrmB, partial [Gammaproteobacteria bacterium]|nr:tRNA (guanosine(46)-N7)-methyltransferase TrmB [Gammaproteobacteria bacterium]